VDVGRPAAPDTAVKALSADLPAEARRGGMARPQPPGLRFARVRVFGKSPLNAIVRLNRWMWRRAPDAWKAGAIGRAYGRVMHGLVRSGAVRQQYFGTFFFRNRPQIETIARLVDRMPPRSTLNAAFLGCSNGAEVYSILYTIRSRRPDLRVVAHAVDISKEILEIARAAVYPLGACDVVGQPIFARTREHEMQALFDVDRATETARLKTRIKEGITWHQADAASWELLYALGLQDLVVANNFLCHMPPPDADRCLRAIGRLVKDGGHLVVSGVDLDVRTRVASDLGWIPVSELLEEIHDGDPAVRNDWPWEYWGLEPFDPARQDWRLRYASVFHLTHSTGRHP
jgi:SAM-dependent methyltransferase